MDAADRLGPRCAFDGFDARRHAFAPVLRCFAAARAPN